MNIKKITAALLAGAVMLSLCSCAGKKKELTVGTDTSPLAYFGGLMTADDVLRDIRKVDLEHKINTDALTSEKHTESDGETVITKWYDKSGKAVYEIRSGFMEETVSLFTRSASGRELTVTYYDDSEGERSAVKVFSEDYEAAYYSLSENPPGEMSVTVYDTGNVPASITYDISGGRRFISDAYYYTDSGLTHFTQWYGTENKPESFEECVCEKRAEVKTSDLSSFEDIPLQFRAGRHSISYTENGGRRSWYLTAPYYFVFQNEADAKAFAAEHGIDPGTVEFFEDDTYYAVLPDVTLKFADGFEELFPFIKTEINDHYSLAVTLNSGGEITGFTPGYAQFY